MPITVKSIWNEHRGILLILILFLAVGLGYSLTTLLFEAPAEKSHFRYARAIAEGRGLPLVPPDEQFPQEHQAPLYYLLTGVLVSPLDLSGPTLPQPNPYHVYNNPGPIEDNRNSYYHTQDEAFPYRGLILAVHLGRLVALIMGALTVLATYAIAYEALEGCKMFSSHPSPISSRRVHPMYKTIALGAAAINAFNPQFVFISSVMSNDTTAAAFSGWSLFLGVHILRRGISWYRSLLLGAAVGLAAISKLNGLAMLPIALLALALAALVYLYSHQQNRESQRRRQGFRLWLTHTLVVGALASLVASWWYIRNWVLYRDPFTLKLASERWGTVGVTRSFNEIVGHWREIEVGFWGLFGHDNLLMDPFVYDILHAIELLAFAGLVVWSIRAWRYARRTSQSVCTVSSWAGLGLVMLASLTAFAGLYRWLQITNLPAGRYLYPAISAISVLLFLGLSGLVPRRVTPILAGGIGIGLLSLTLVTPFRYIAPAYTTPPLIEVDATVPNRTDISYGGVINLAGFEIQEETVRPGERLHVTLYWQPMEHLDPDLTVAVRVLGWDGTVVGSKDTFPGLGRYPTSLWQPGKIVKDTYPVPIRFDAKTPARLLLDVSLYHHPTMFVLPKLDAAGNEVSQLSLGEAKLISNSTKPADITHATHFTLGNEILLVGYSLSGTSPYPPDSSPDLTLYWQPLTKPALDYTVFIHLLDEEGRVIASWDEPPMGNNYPTHLWSEGEVLEDTHRLSLPPGLPSGDYQLNIGLYQLDTLQRLSVVNAEGRILPENAIPLLTFPVRE